MIIGRNIRIYLKDGSTTGIRHAEIVNWTGQAIAVPRTQITSLSGWPESNRPGVYFLFGVDEVSGSQALYIGESENVLERLKEHLKGKDFWNEAVFFTSKDENLTKSHVKYLESRLVGLAKLAGRYVVLNGNNPPTSSLPRGDRDAMDEFAANLRTLLGVISHKALEPVASHEQVPVDKLSLPNTSDTEVFPRFTLSHSKINAKAILNNEGIVVLQGSELLPNTTSSLAEGYKKLRQQLVDNGTLVAQDNQLVFTKDQLFTSPSQAAAIIVGYPINGRASWKNTQGLSIKELEDQLLN